MWQRILKLVCLTACEVWKLKKLNPLADLNDIKLITKRINGGYTNLNERMLNFETLYKLSNSSEKTKPIPVSIVAKRTAPQNQQLREISKPLRKHFKPGTYAKLCIHSYEPNSSSPPDGWEIVYNSKNIC